MVDVEALAVVPLDAGDAALPFACDAAAEDELPTAAVCESPPHALSEPHSSAASMHATCARRSRGCRLRCADVPVRDEFFIAILLPVIANQGLCLLSWKCMHRVAANFAKAEMRIKRRFKREKRSLKHLGVVRHLSFRSAVSMSYDSNPPSFCHSATF